jgi:aminoglycoside phosphotransferase (APT) family kinase protein
VPEIVHRDPTETAAVLGRWLATRLPKGAKPAVYDLTAPTATGFSNETIMCRASWVEDGQQVDRRLVFRVHPTTNLLFLDADFSVQYRVMSALADGDSGVPVPPLRWYEEDPSWLGVPFFLMDHVEGEVAGEPTYHNRWLGKASPEEQRRLWWTGVEALAHIHRVDWQKLGLGWLAGSDGEKPDFSRQLRHYRRFLDWSADGPTPPVAEAAYAWLIDNQPEETGDVALSWGDSRIANIIWDDFTVGAVIDWEMATLGPPELDFGWWLYFDRQFSEGIGQPLRRPVGFPTREETIDRYSELIGRPVKDAFYYEVFAGFRFAVIMARLAELLRQSEGLSELSDLWHDNLATQQLAMLLDLPHPGGA